MKISIALTTVLLASTTAYADNGTGAPAGWPDPMMGEMAFGSVMVDRLEYGRSEEGETATWDAQGWYGTDKRKLWIKTEGEGPLGDTPESAELQFLYGQMLSPFFDLQLGLRHDLEPATERTFAVLGIQGLAPYWFETDAAIFTSEDGDVSFRAEFEYEWLFTQKLILQSRFEFVLSANEVPEYSTGRGLAETELGLRLRYEFKREFAPYVGMSWAKNYGKTAEFARESGASDSDVSVVAGFRFWF